MKCSIAQVEQLSNESVLQVQSFIPSKDFFKQESVGIAHNGTAIVLLGPGDDQESLETCCRLLKCPQFTFLVEQLLGQGSFTRITIENEVLENCSYPVITNKTTECIEAILIADRYKAAAIAALCCVQSPIIRCFVPSAESLSIQIVHSKFKNEDLA